MSDDDEYLEYKKKIQTLKDDKRKLKDDKRKLEDDKRKLKDDKRKLEDEYRKMKDINCQLEQKIRTLKQKNKEAENDMMNMGENGAEEGTILDNVMVQRQRIRTSDQRSDNREIVKEQTIGTSDKNPDNGLRVRGQNLSTSDRRHDNSVMVDGQRMDTSSDNGVVVDEKKMETSDKSRENKKEKGEEIQIGNQSSVYNWIELNQETKHDEQMKQTAIGTSTTEKPAVDTKHIPPRGLVVICCHQTFHQSHKLHTRYNALDDQKLMKQAWELYGCKVIEFFDENTDFYKTKLIDKITEELVPDIKLFVFVLSTHGEERQEGKIGSSVHEIQHIFFTKDGHLNTQEFMNKIAAIEKVNNKLKVFVIQTCRSRTEVKDHNIDHGYDIEVTENDGLLKSEIDQDITASKYNIPHDGITKADAKMDSETLIKVEEGLHTFDTMELVPHCDDCIVLFASMARRYAYSTFHSEKWTGGWAIKSLHDALTNYKSQDKVHILDILTAVNCEVGKRELEVKTNNEMTIIKSQSCFFHNIAFEEEELYLQKKQTELRCF